VAVERVPFRYSWSRWVLVAFWGFIWSLLAGAMFASFEGGAVLQVGARVLEGSCLVALGWIIVRLTRMGVFVDQEYVQFRNVLRTTTARWSDIERFEPPAGYGQVRKAGLIARLEGGRTISATAVGRGPIEGPGAAEAVTDHLNRLLATHGNRASEDAFPTVRVVSEGNRREGSVGVRSRARSPRGRTSIATSWAVALA